jgi:hypothetical protein
MALQKCFIVMVVAEQGLTLFGEKCSTINSTIKINGTVLSTSPDKLYNIGKPYFLHERTL